MGKVTVINPKLKLLLDEFSRDYFLSTSFYFTGGTALSLYYLQHRESIDLDFFSRDSFDPKTVSEIVNSWAQKYHCSLEYVTVVNTHVFNLTFPDKKTVKIDFSLYPYRALAEGEKIAGVTVDSRLDIAVNKLLTIVQRTAVKDFVDLYFLLQDFTIWDLMEGVKVKFKMKLDPFVVSSDMFKVDQFEYLPKMIKPLTLEELKQFFREKAEKLGRTSVE